VKDGGEGKEEKGNSIDCWKQIKPQESNTKSPISLLDRQYLNLNLNSWVKNAIGIALALACHATKLMSFMV